VAAALQSALGIEADLIEGDRGEFSVWVDSRRVAVKQNDEFPSENAVIAAVRAAIR
jgi:hypothetical protein